MGCNIYYILSYILHPAIAIHTVRYIFWNSSVSVTTVSSRSLSKRLNSEMDNMEIVLLDSYDSSSDDDDAVFDLHVSLLRNNKRKYNKRRFWISNHIKSMEGNIKTKIQNT